MEGQATTPALPAPARRGTRMAADSGVLLPLIAALALVPLLATPVLPMIDFYNHIARYQVLAHIGDDPFLAANYRAAWALLPNIGLDLLAMLLVPLVPAATLPHLIVAIILLVQLSGAVALNRALTGRTQALVALLAVPLLYSFILGWGFANFLFGLGLALWALAWWVTQRDRPWRALRLSAPIAIVILLVHGLAFALYGLALAGLEFGFWWQGRPRRLAGLLAALPPLLAQAIIPVTLFLASRTSSAAVSNAGDSARRLAASGDLSGRLWHLASYRLTTIVRVAEGPSFAFDLAGFTLTLLLLALAWRRGALRLVPAALPVLGIAALLVALTPPALFGVGYVADRMPLFAALLLVAALEVRAEPAWLIAGVLALVGVRVAAISTDWQLLAADDRDFRRVAAALPRHALVETVITRSGRLDTAPRCQMYGPRLIAEYHAAGRLFAYAGQQPLALAGPLAAHVAAAPRPPVAERSRSDYAARLVATAARAGFPWLLLCDGAAVPLPPGGCPIAAAGRFTLIRLGDANGPEGRACPRRPGP